MSNFGIPVVYSTDKNNLPWNIDFFPRGIKYHKAQLINVFNMQAAVEIPETILRTIRLSVTCKRDLETEQRFKVGVLNIFILPNNNSMAHFLCK